MSANDDAKKEMFLILLGWSKMTISGSDWWRHPEGTMYTWMLSEAYDFEMKELSIANLRRK